MLCYCMFLVELHIFAICSTSFTFVSTLILLGGLGFKKTSADVQEAVLGLKLELSN